MSGYWKSSDTDQVCFTPDGYFRTGDLGVINDEGYLKVVDRKKDVILVSGFNVYPNEVEAVASTYPGILECVCVGIPCPQAGEAVRILIVLKQNALFDEGEFRKYCRNHLTGYKIPRVVDVVDALPKSAVGKVLRREIGTLIQ